MEDLGKKKLWGFVYKLTLYDLKTGKLKFHYIGKKNFESHTTKYATKKELEELPKSTFRRKKVKGVIKYYRTVTKESNWLDYTSSNEFIRVNKKKFRIQREILRLCDCDNDLSYQEAKEIISQEALDDAVYLNDGVSIRRFGKKLIKH